MSLIKLYNDFNNRFIFLLIAVVAGCIVVAIPLIGTLHIDSAVLAGVIGAITGAWVGSRQDSRDRDVFWMIGLLYCAAVPLVVRDLVMGCFSGDGVAFWLFIPPFSTTFGFAFGRAMRYLIPAYAHVLSLLGIFAIAVIGLLIVLLSFPQLYYFNHIFGYWPGPIYDESVSFTSRLIFYRSITIMWICVLWMVPHITMGNRMIKSVFILLLFLLVTSYTQAAKFGIYSPSSHIRSELKGLYQTKHFDIYFSSKYFDEDEIVFIGQLHEFHFSELTDTLQIDWPDQDRIESYLYGHSWEMQEITGAKGVSFVPVWLHTPQLHMQKTALDRTLRHELVHVVARTFGNRILNASWNIGLVEGLAVALSPASSTHLTVDQLVASNNTRFNEGEIRELFSLTGFYLRSGSVAYSVAGSFVRSLLMHHSVENFKSAYRHSSLMRGFDDLLIPAIERWHYDLTRVPITPEEQAMAKQIFSAPSIFDTKCPRKITKQQACINAEAREIARADTLSYFGHRDKATLRNWLTDVLDGPIEMDRFEDYRQAIYLLAFDVIRSRNIYDDPESHSSESGTENLPVIRLIRRLSGDNWRPVQLQRLEEASRFARYVSESS